RTTEATCDPRGCFLRDLVKSTSCRRTRRPSPEGVAGNALVAPSARRQNLLASKFRDRVYYNGTPGGWSNDLKSLQLVVHTPSSARIRARSWHIGCSRSENRMAATRLRPTCGAQSRVRIASGFSILEMLFVVSLIGVVSAIAVPSIGNALGYFRLSGDAR